MITTPLDDLVNLSMIMFIKGTCDKLYNLIQTLIKNVYRFIQTIHTLQRANGDIRADRINYLNAFQLD
ncbi:hypothetical protein CAL7102_04948 [Dulcicalothrix desertica PCC 7102]|nr:hypothetical protein CAL7102_04948 [Dulcicalothrix desertica PCC 7102]